LVSLSCVLYKGIGLDGQSVLKKITIVLAIVTAIACGLIGRAFPYKMHAYVHKVDSYAMFSWWQYNNGKITAEEMDKKVLSTGRMYDDLRTTERNKKAKEPINEMNKKKNRGKNKKTEYDLEKQQTIKDILEYRKETNFWYNKSKADLMWMSVLFSFIGVVVGFIGGGIIFWLYNWYVYYRYKIYELDFPYRSAD
jgi:hypothetical protein